MKIKIDLLHDDAVTPKYAKDLDVGADVYIPEGVTLEAGKVHKVGLGIAVHIPNGHVGFVVPRSGTSVKGINALSVPIDPSYTGEIHAILHNTTDTPIHLEPGSRVAQLVIIPCIRVQFSWTELEQRKDAGFGSTGIK